MNFEDIKGAYKQIKDFPNYYITENGDVFSNRLTRRKKEPRLYKMSPKNPGKDDKYLNVVLCRDDGMYTKSIHRLVAEHFVDGYFEGAVVNHIDGNNRNNHADNLEWTTTADNVHKSYLTSGIGAKRNYKIWELYDPQGSLLAKFESHKELGSYIVKNKLDTSPTGIVKYRKSKGYTIKVKEKENRKL